MQIYTSVSHWTCGGYTGSLGYEEIDAKSFVDWGFDFVKVSAMWYVITMAIPHSHFTRFRIQHDTCGGYHTEPPNECGVGVIGGGKNCIRNSTTKMAAALRKYGGTHILS
jgi:hypothetical protein